MKYVCRNCMETFIVTKRPKHCPFCSSENIGSDGKARQTALDLIEHCNQLTMQLDKLMEKYKPLYLERECALNTLRVYKQRGIITDVEMPKIKRDNIQKELTEYRKKRREGK